MSDRGEGSFAHFPKIAAKMYDRLMRLKQIEIQISEIAKDLLSKIEKGRLLDVGTGHGRLLAEIFSKNSSIELYGLDISKAMLSVANNNLKEISVNLQQGNIKESPYESNFFDLVTSTGSFYLWNQPIESLEEIFRILKPNCSAILYETHKDYNLEELNRILKLNLKGEGFIVRKLSPKFLKKQLKMTYSIEEVVEIIKQTPFAKVHEIQKITLANLPIWIRIKLSKTVN